ncbi:uncharacterized protein [Triticum aestivum]|uniref:uncharacterized protein isoform X7 n=1 Tax=Triticum aestivum TaxID=4565 RepID=UPI001D035618|nr:uncharacterized protein LOC123156027 isoform X7 [Triticum aestivum]
MLKFKRSKKQLNFLSYMRTLDSGLRRESYCMGNRESFTCKGTEYCHSSVSAASKVEGHFYCLICSIIELRKFDSFRMSSSELWSSETDGCTAVNKCSEEFCQMPQHAYHIIGTRKFREVNTVGDRAAKSFKSGCHRILI